MQELKRLKIDPELKDLLPPLTTDEYKQLEKNLLSNGYDKNFPIITWNGFIVDGHNRYELCLKHNIEYCDRYISYETKEEVMSWMIDTQLGRRNLSPIQRIAVAERYKAKIQAKAKASYSENVGRPNKEEKSLSERTTINPVETRKEIAKIAKVGSGTIARYDVVMKSDNEELKQKMLKEEIPITAAYDLLKKEKDDNKVIIQPVKSIESETKENITQKNTKICTICKKVKPLIDFFGDDDICKECKITASKITYKKSESQGGGCFKDLATGHMIKSSITGIDEDIMNEIKTEKNAFDYVVAEREIVWLEETCNDFIENVDNQFFTLINAVKKFSDLDIDIAVDVLNELKEKIDTLIKKFNENKKENK
jgi:hypothetical protein